MMSKKEQRMESKKRKAAAFLQLVDQDKKQEIKDDDLHPDLRKEVEAKKTKLELLSQGSADGEDVLAKFSAAVKERRQASMARPKVFLTLDAIRDEDNNIPPLFIMDIQHLILFALEGNSTSFKPRWCKLLRCAKVSNVVVVAFDGVGEDEYKLYKSAFSNLDGLFDMSVTLTCPSQYGVTVQDELFSVHPSITQLKDKFKVPKPLAVEISQAENPGFVSLLNNIQTHNLNLPQEEVFPRTHLLLSHSQLSAHGYPLPLEDLSDKYKDFVFTAEKYEAVTSTSPMYAIDCEMCMTLNGEHELTWVSVVNEDCEVIYETLVKPYKRIVNYLTRYSGVTEKILRSVNTRIEEVQSAIQKLLPADAILCGQSLNADLKALKMFHPYVIDTSVIYNLSGERNVKPSLRKLSLLFLGKLIQDDKAGHNPCEDAISTMELVKLKLKKGLSFGDIRLGGIIYPKFKSVSLDPQQLDLVDPKNCEAKESTTDTSEEKIAEGSSIDGGVEEQAISPNSIQSDNLTNQTVPIATSCADSEIEKTRTILKKIEHRKNFFKFKGIENYLTSIFLKLHSINKKAAIIDGVEVIEKVEGDSPSLVSTVTTCDKETKGAAVKAVSDSHFLWAQFHNYANITDQDASGESKVKCLHKMDKRMSSVFSAAPPNSICLVVLSGSSNKLFTNNAMCFVKVKI